MFFTRVLRPDGLRLFKPPFAGWPIYAVPACFLVFGVLDPAYTDSSIKMSLGALVVIVAASVTAARARRRVGSRPPNG